MQLFFVSDFSDHPIFRVKNGMRMRIMIMIHDDHDGRPKPGRCVQIHRHLQRPEALWKNPPRPAVSMVRESGNAWILPWLQAIEQKHPKSMAMAFAGQNPHVCYIHYTTFHFITLQYIAYIHIYIHTYIHYTTLHYITFHFITFHYITLHCIHTYIHTYTWIYMNIHTYVRTYVHTYIYIHTYIHTYIHRYIDK